MLMKKTVLKEYFVVVVGFIGAAQIIGNIVFFFFTFCDDYELD